MTSRLIAQMKADSSRAIAVATIVDRLPFLASDESSYCVGTNLSCDGGTAATGGPYPI